MPPTAVASPATSDAARSSAKAAETHALKTQWPRRSRSGKGACPTAVQPSKFRNAWWPRCQSGAGPGAHNVLEDLDQKWVKPRWCQSSVGPYPHATESPVLPKRGGQVGQKSMEARTQNQRRPRCPQSNESPYTKGAETPYILKRQSAPCSQSGGGPHHKALGAAVFPKPQRPLRRREQAPVLSNWWTPLPQSGKGPGVPKAAAAFGFQKRRRPLYNSKEGPGVPEVAEHLPRSSGGLGVPTAREGPGAPQGAKAHTQKRQTPKHSQTNPGPCRRVL